jgi:hypothetical protein
MGSALEHGKSAEVFVQSHENSSFLEGQGQNSFVSRVLFPIATPNYIMPSRLKRIPRRDRHTRVEKNLQGATSMDNGSIRSLAVSRRA